MSKQALSSPELVELSGKINDRRKQLATIMAEAGPELDLSKVKSIDGDSVAKVAHMRGLNDEMADLAGKKQALQVVLQAAQYAADTDPGDVFVDVEPAGRKSFGAQFVASDAYKLKGGRSVGPEATVDVGLKTLMTTAAGFAPETFRSGRVVDFATRPIQVADLIPIVPTTQNANVYMEETTFTNNAAEVAEGGTYGEAALVYTEQTSPVRKVAVWLPVTDEQLEDEAGIAARLNARLPFMIRQRVDSQVLVGNGTAPNLRGINNVVGIQTQAKGADPVPDAVYKAIVLCQTVGFVQPNAYVTNPTDWQDVRLLRTADGIYIWGSPSEVGPQMIWGLQVVQSVSQTLNTGLVGDFANFAEISERRGIDVQVTNSHGTFFIEGKQAIRADVRLALTVYRPAAFCQVTGI